MATITVTIPDAEATVIYDALCQGAGLTPSSAANAQIALVKWVTSTVQNIQQSQAQAKAVVPPVAPIAGIQ